MKKIYDSVAMGILAVAELKELIQDERNDEKRDALKSVRFAYYYLIDNMIKQFGVTRYNVADSLVENGYEYRDALDIAKAYEDWAKHVIKVGDNL